MPQPIADSTLLDFLLGDDTQTYTGVCGSVEPALQSQTPNNVSDDMPDIDSVFGKQIQEEMRPEKGCLHV